ncbi:ATP synthase F0 subunit B [Tetragenococcus halophilus]|uniref:ATP synthase subunit b n=1 Tax=Tetragenococcus halophilus TaxID=51669 RepID=A0A3G5FKI7_TETHA|nr:F0F1 ATP synthase subunit B [Tetragenococcus halophilus]AYW50765.1 ATP synthase F0 subunit B [Tetragenococcus halophilus]MCF1675064.1 F0F1 ATP synthase subunit B [Tetragenococcus halophilus]MCO8283697.1 F0F1 ATP synthase subunit B [Tetragenococcus halophilus]MCO8298433.1 F0F1 ATP synthase subunit B [Tetragenococcus halophilus]MCT8310201.1 F0F1 ATP synthase subunit B [Tetragenococcus halophilus]
MLNQLVLSVADVQNTTISNIVVVTGSFVLLLALLKKFAWNAIADMMNKREKKIANDLDSAEQSRAQAKELEQTRQEQLQTSKSEASDIIKNAKSSGESSRQQIISDAQKEVSQMKENAQEDISNERQAALSSVKGEVGDLSVQIAEQIINQELSKEAHETLINQYIESIGSEDETR